MMMEPIYVTGAGIVSALGAGKDMTLASLKSELSGVGQMKYLPSRHTELPVGEVPMSNEEMMSMLGIDNDPLLSRTVLMGRLALQEALQQAGLEREVLERVHFVSATTVGCMDRREEHYAQEADCNQQFARVAIDSCGSSTEMIAAPFGDFASLSTVSTACSSATNAFMTGADMLRCGMGEIAVVGGSECLSLFHLNGFNSLMNVAHDVCRPFDQNREGLNLGEGAAYLVIETASSAARRGVRPLCQLSGYGNRCDAHHQTASSPDGEGAYLAMNAALEMAGLQPGQIDYVNAHGTGTQNNDESETHALQRVFGAELPPISSTKAFTGHTTSASGSIEAVICVLALENQFLPVNYNWSTPIVGGFLPVTENKEKAELRHVMSNAFGFGGNDSSMILSKYDA